jgi:hypothetical protein
MKSPTRLSRALIGLTFFVPLSQVSFAPAQTPNSSFLGSRWDLPGPGNAKKVNNGADYGPGEATFSIMGAGIGFQLNAPDPDHPANAVTFNFDTLLPLSPAGTAAALFQQAVNLWMNGSNLKFKSLGPVLDGGGPIGGPANMGSNTGDIRAGVLKFTQPPPVESQPNMEVLAHAFQPDTATQGIIFGAPTFGSIGGDIHFRPHMNVDPSGVNWVNDANAGFGQIDLLTVMIHEVGHALGLGHNTGDANSVMQPMYTGVKRQLSATDIMNIKELYSVQAAPEPASLAILMLAGTLAMKRRSRIA